jgi:hypothetical protein
LLEPAAQEFMFDGKRRPGQRLYEDVAEFWAPVVEDIDAILTPLEDE